MCDEDYEFLCNEYYEKYKIQKLDTIKPNLFILRKNGEDYSLMTEIVLFVEMRTDSLWVASERQISFRNSDGIVPCSSSGSLKRNRSLLLVYDDKHSVKGSVYTNFC